MDALNRDIWLFHLAFRQLVRLPDGVLAQRGLSRIHHRLLWVIGRFGEVAVGDLAERLEITRQGLHGPMRQLREAGLITSRPSERNRTIQLVSLTQQGTDLEQELNALQRRHMELALSDAGEQAQDGWRRVMSALGQVLPADDASARPPDPLHTEAA